MTRVLTVLLVLALMAGVAAVGVQWLAPRIEQDLQNRVTAALAERGLLFAEVEVKGRAVTLVGDAPDGQARDQALAAASQVFGVASVRDGLSVDGVGGLARADSALPGETVPSSSLVVAKPGEPTPTKATKKMADNGDYTLTIIKKDERVTLTGMVPDVASRDVLHRLAETHYGAAHVDDKLTVVPGAPAGWRSAAGTVLFNLTNLESATATLSNTEVMVSGEALDATYSTQTEDSIRKALPTAYRVAFAVEVNAPVAVAQASVTTPVTEAVKESTSASAAVEPAAGTEVSVTEPITPPAPIVSATAEPVVAAMGCAAMGELKQHKVRFGFDKVNVTDTYGPTVRKVAGIIQACEGRDVTVAGYTDQTGSKLYNQWLSEQRAQAGVRALMREGVAKERLSAVGYGEKNPEASNKTKAGRSANRRIEFVDGKLEGAAKVEAGKAAVVSATAAVSDSATTDSAKSWWDRVSGAISRAEVAVSKTVTSVSATGK